MHTSTFFLAFLCISMVAIVSASPRCTYSVSQQRTQGCQGSGNPGRQSPPLQCKYECSIACNCTTAKSNQQAPPTFNMQLPPEYVSCTKLSPNEMYNGLPKETQEDIANSVKFQCEATKLCTCTNMIPAPAARSASANAPVSVTAAPKQPAPMPSKPKTNGTQKPKPKTKKAQVVEIKCH